MSRFLRNFNYIQFAAMLVLIVVGTVAIHSAGNARAQSAFHVMWISHLSTALFGLVIYFVIAFFDYRKIMEYLSWPCFGAALVMLIAVLVFGTDRFGGRRWLWFFQPSEIAKPAVLVLLASLLGGPYAERLRSFRGFLALAVLAAVPSLLILAEPDLGTMLTLVPAIVLMFFIARVWLKGLVVFAISGLLFAIVLLGSVYEAERPGTSPARREEILSHIPLKPHQVRRIKVFLFPDSDVRSSGYNLRQAKISIGSGGFFGKGIGKGESNHLKYLPQAISMNDFIFCVWAEETGYLGSFVLLFLYALLILPGCWTACIAGDERGRLLALGLTVLLFAHVYINIAMSIGLVPITGLPLPFLSNGRTFLVVAMVSLGLMQSIAVHRETDGE